MSVRERRICQSPLMAPARTKTVCTCLLKYWVWLIPSDKFEIYRNTIQSKLLFTEVTDFEDFLWSASTTKVKESCYINHIEFLALLRRRADQSTRQRICQQVLFAPPNAVLTKALSVRWSECPTLGTSSFHPLLIYWLK